MAEVGRRLILGIAAGVLVVTTDHVQAAGQLAWAFSFPGIEGGTIDLAALRGRVLLITNTASFCGYTSQYEALQTLHEARADEGLSVIGVPSGDFNQESSDNKTVKTFCDTRFGISFPLAALTHVRGEAAAPFYAWVKAETGWQPKWNFNKVLIGRDGRVLGTFGAGDDPDSPTVSQAISVALGKATATG